ncbi:MAG: Hsp70 family protein [Candidatus Jettenia sp. CY-1]|nr:MAG: Hsp70 family protein [Candidatus Jettenia sp. CY-1]
MSNMINFGIDLGTTNSLIAKFNKGIVEVFKNPNGFKETLPSIVGFRNDRILVGDQAKNYAENDSKNVFRQFKRKMGTTEVYKIQSLGQSKTPIELSAFVLKELKNFIHTQEVPEAVVITIPASFDMVQSNATKEAGYMAGFKQVVLLQEPIAASLAYANKEKIINLKNSQWIVYDLGGGTFDVALVKIVEGELKVIDHEGDNYLGGADFDVWIVEKIIVPQIEKKGQFTNLLAQMKDEKGRFNTLWYTLLRLAEESKIELTTRTSSEIDLGRIHNLVDEAGKTLLLSDMIIPVTRSEFEEIIKDAVYSTAEMLKKILTRNSLHPQDLKFVLMVGGSTYIPFVRKRIEELLGIPVNNGIAPTNAIAIGAAYFAATKEINTAEKDTNNKSSRDTLRIKVSYNRASQEKEELFSAKVEGITNKLFYRITRDDGGYDSGLKALSPRIMEDLSLQEDVYNLFTFKVYDSQNNIIPTDFNSIQIAQGKYSVAGQLLPEDITLVLDDRNTGDTKLKLIFARNSVLPTKTKMTVEASKTIIHGSDDDIRIIVVEGPSENHFTVNKPVGLIVVSAKKLTKDIIRGTDIDLTFEVSESRDLTVTAYINPSGPNFYTVFTPKFRDVPVETLCEEVQILKTKLENEKDEAVTNENYEVATSLEKLVEPVKEIHGEALLLTPDDVTDDRYKLQDRMRKIAQELSKITAGKQIERLRNEYHSLKDNTQQIVVQSGNDLESKQFNEVVTQEHIFLSSSNPQKIEDAINNLHRISFQILRRTPDFLIGWFEHLLTKRESFNDQLQAKNLIESGKRSIASEDYEKLAEINTRLHNLLPQKEIDTKETRFFTGIC